MIQVHPGSEHGPEIIITGQHRSVLKPKTYTSLAMAGMSMCLQGVKLIFLSTAKVYKETNVKETNVMKEPCE